MRNEAKNCERLIKAASEYRLDQGILHVLHVAKIHGIFLIIHAKVKLLNTCSEFQNHMVPK